MMTIFYTLKGRCRKEWFKKLYEGIERKKKKAEENINENSIKKDKCRLDLINSLTEP